MSNYAVGWDLDPATLPRSLSRKNPGIAPTAKLPQVLKIAIFYDVNTLPFQRNNFGVPYAVNLWRHNENLRRNIATGRDLKNATFSIEVNGVRKAKYVYLLKRMYDLDLVDEYDDEIETSCKVLEFQAS
jgi:hypothetical protein